MSETIVGCNAFTYCENDPINDEDASGAISFKKIKNVVSSLLKAFAKNVIKNVTKLFRIRNGYLEVSNSVIAAGIDGTIMLFCAVGAFFAKAAIKIIIKEYLLKRSFASNKFIKFLINLLLTPGIVGGIIAALGFVFKWTKYKIDALVSDVVQNILAAKTRLLKKVYKIYSAISSIGSFVAFCFDLLDGEPNDYFRLRIKFS